MIMLFDSVSTRACMVESNSPLHVQLRSTVERVSPLLRGRWMVELGSPLHRERE